MSEKTCLNSIEAWNLFCKTVFEYHDENINKLDEQRRTKYLDIQLKLQCHCNKDN